MATIHAGRTLCSWSNISIHTYHFLRAERQASSYTCRRCLHITLPYNSGHNRWSKIKHDKAGVDARKNKERSSLAREIQMASKLYGANLANNPKLAAVLATAKKAGFPKALMESAIARGQGISTSGAALEKVTLEAMMPPSIAFVFDIETDNRLRTLGDVRLILKKNGATVTPTAYLFERKGRLVFDKDDRGLGVDDVLEDAIEAGAEDVHLDDKGNIVVWTDPSATTTAAEALSQSLKLAATSSEIIWSPNEDTMASVDTEETFNAVSSIMEALGDITGVSAYCNLAQGAVDDESWLELRDKFAA